MFFQKCAGDFTDLPIDFPNPLCYYYPNATINLSVEKNTIVKGEDFLMKKDYMARLERAARWRLPPQEAEDVIADYRDIVSDPPRTEEQLRREVGDPEQVIKLLVSPPRAYRIWQAAFAVMAACILLPGVTSHGPFVRIWDKCFAGFGGASVWPGGPHGYWGPVLGLLGMVGALVWFRRTGRKEQALPRVFRVLTAALAVWLVVLLVVNWFWMRDPQSFAAMWGEVPLTLYFFIPIGVPGTTVPRSVDMTETLFQFSGTVTACIGVYALVRARTGDRRWTAVYILAITVTMVAMLGFAVMLGGFGSNIQFLENWHHPYLWLFAAVTAVGLVGTGVALI